MGQSADQLRQEIEQKRDDAAQKIDAIEMRVQDTVQQARDTVQDTVQQARDTVVGTVDQTVQKAKESFDLRRQVEEKPLVALGAALVGGFVLGGILGDDDRRSSSYEGSSADLPRSATRTGGVRTGIRNAARESGLDDTIQNLTAAFMGSLTERLRSTVQESFPALADKLPPAHDGGQRQSLQAGSGASGAGTVASGASASAATTDASGRPTPYFSSGEVSGSSVQG